MDSNIGCVVEMGNLSSVQVVFVWVRGGSLLVLGAAMASQSMMQTGAYTWERTDDNDGNMILQRLREETHENHKRLESRLDLLQRAISLERYRDLLARFYGFYAPIEPRLEALCQKWLPEIEFWQRRRTPALEQDLEALGWGKAQIEALPLCEALPMLADAPQALGCLYVLEGSTLGGQIISRHLQSVHGLDGESGAAFFRSYGPQVGAMWRAFGVVANAYPAGPEQEVRMIRAACDTFVTLERWALR